MLRCLVLRVVGVLSVMVPDGGSDLADVQPTRSKSISVSIVFSLYILSPPYIFFCRKMVQVLDSVVEMCDDPFKRCPQVAGACYPGSGSPCAQRPQVGCGLSQAAVERLPDFV